MSSLAGAGYAIITEEDLEVSPDFFLYFAHTIPALELDPTLFCVSAWNDQVLLFWGAMHLR